MKNNEIHTTSSLRQERNILGTFSRQPSGCRERPKVHNTGIGSLCILFMESLAQSDMRPGMILRYGVILRPFLEYLEQTHGITAVTGLERSHVEGYVATVSHWYEAQEKTLTTASRADDLLSVVKMFCQYLYTEGVVTQDYGQSVPATGRAIRC